MNNILYACLIATAAVTCNAQQKAKDYAVLSGTIINLDSDSLMIFGNDEENYRFQKKIPINKKGMFRDTLKAVTGGYFITDRIREGWRISIYLKNGYDLTISLDAERPNQTVAFEGTGVAPNNYLRKENLLREEFWKNNQNIFESGFDYFKNRLKTLTDGISEELSNAGSVDSAFVAQQKAALEQMKNGMVFQYVMNSFWTSDSAMFDLEEPEFIAKAEAYIADVAQSFTSDTEEVASVALGIDGWIWQELKQILVGDFAQRKFIAQSKGKPSPTFTDYVSFDGGTASLADFKGKYVYIDVWATWCGACIAEIPSLKAVEEEYRSKNIAFVGISVDYEKDFDKWEAMVKAKELSGTQLFASQSRESPFIEGYKITGIPRFILIDPEGNVVSANAPRPSEDRLKALFEELKI